MPIIVETYKKFAENYYDSLKLWENFKENDQIAKFLEECMNHPLCEKLDIGSFLINSILSYLMWRR